LNHEPIEKIPDGGIERRGCNFWTFLPARLGGTNGFLHSWFAQTGRLDCLCSARHALDIGRRSCGNAHAGTSRIGSCGHFGAVHLFIVIGLFTRINAALLVCALSGAILQNLLAGRDPQLAILYTLVVVTLVFIGSGKYSLDARMFAKAETPLT
jgi:TQO small subunit DoxD